nr:hypothetical protein [Tanacetum cinerariifolium]
MIGDDNHDGDHPKTSNPSPPVPPLTSQIPYIVSSIKLHILKKGKYDIWAMKMEHYLCHTDYPIWQMADAKEMWEAIKSRFGSNDESKKIVEIDAGYSVNKARDNGRRPAYHEDSKALVAIDEEDID